MTIRLRLFIETGRGMGFFDQFNGGPVRGLLGSRIYRGLDVSGLDPSRIPDALANNAMLPQPEREGPSTLEQIAMALSAGLGGFAAARSAPVTAKQPSIDYTSPPRMRPLRRGAQGGNSAPWALTKKYGKGA